MVGVIAWVLGLFCLCAGVSAQEKIIKAGGKVEVLQ